MTGRLIRAFIVLISYIPFPVSQFLGKMLSVPFYVIPLERTAVSLNNIIAGFDGTLGRARAKRLNRKVLRHFGQMILETPHVLRMCPENVARYVYPVNLEHFLMAIEKGRGLFLLTAHCGNWEFLSAYLSQYVGPSAVVVRPFDFHPLDQVMNQMRSRFGLELIHKQRAMRKILHAIRQNKPVGILLDQNVDWYDGVFIKFMGRWACTNKGLALMAMKTGAPVVPAFCVRQRDGRYAIFFEKEVRLVRTGDKTRDIEENTALFTGVIEKYVKRYPDQWFWFHKRWKTLPYCRLPDDFYVSRREEFSG